MQGIKNVLVSMLIVLTAVIIPTISYAAATTTPRDDMDNDNGNSLRDLIFLEGLSSGNNFSDLFVLDRLSGGDSDLGDLFILNQLFGADDIAIDGMQGGNLGNLFVLDELFGNGNGVFGGDSDLGDLFILDNLFGGSGGIFR